MNEPQTPRTKRKHIQCGPGTAPNLPFRLMVSPQGKVRRVVTATSIHVDPDNNDYGRQVLSDRRMRGWLFYDSCPLNDGAVANVYNEPPCPGPLREPCPHLKYAIDSRLKDFRERSNAEAEKFLSSFHKQERLHAEAQAQASKQHNEILQALTQPRNDNSEIAEMRAALAALTAELASLKKSKAKKDE